MVCLPCIQWPCRGRVVWYGCLVGDVWCGMFALYSVAL